MSKSFLFYGRIGRPCTMGVVADTVEEAEKKLAADEFYIVDENTHPRNVSFDWDGTDPEEEDAEGAGA
jgi:hypothetical protein